jgi:hypothetical protein
VTDHVPRGENLADVATRESRAKGGRARAAKIRAERERDRQAAEENLTELTTAALDRLDEILSAADERAVIELTCEILSRVVAYLPLDVRFSTDEDGQPSGVIFNFPRGLAQLSGEDPRP